MHITIDDAGESFIFRAVSQEESYVLARIVGVAKVNDKFEYGGRANRDDENLRLEFYFGAAPEPRTTRIGVGLAMITTVYVGGIKLVLQSDDESSENHLVDIRYTCFGATGGLLYLEGSASSDGVQIKVCCHRCMNCNRPMIRNCRLGSSVCDQCAKVCHHDYDLRGEYCVNCSRLRSFIESTV